MQSHSIIPSPPGLHVACIMDGNGRWAEARGLARAAGHREGVEAVRRVVEAAPGLGVGTLTLYAFSSDNWRRPAHEVDALMGLLALHLRTEVPRLKKSGVRLTVIGRRDRLTEAVRSAVARAEWETARSAAPEGNAGGTRVHLRVAVDYSARDALLTAAHRWAGGAPAPPEAPPSREAFETHLATAMRCPGAPAVDLLLRTGGEQRLSDFLLWECAYAELLFLDLAWPDVTGETLADAVEVFRGRQRRFGGLARTG